MIVNAGLFYIPSHCAPCISQILRKKILNCLAIVVSSVRSWHNDEDDDDSDDDDSDDDQGDGDVDDGDVDDGDVDDGDDDC